MTAIRELQERAARALPAEQVERAGEWWLRHTPGASWWAGSVLPHGHPGADDLARRIARAERFYGERGVTTRFQIGPGACPDGLDAVLAERGYRRASPMSLRTAPVARVLDGADGPLRVHIENTPTPAWFAAWHAVHGDGGDPRPDWDLLARLRQPSAYAAVTDGAEVIAVGRATADTGWAGLFGMATLPEARGKGAARAVLAGLARWAACQGASDLYLQVERDNGAAVRLYERAGFTEACAYHYRVAS
ncbi:GNAT family N-acetyltransferase [Prauserella endophytica]|uniref:GNAT family N-acetyltransferase n=1 Tax=Prauserella endophytica TaxID=1592324 RepID=A0ABY2RY97_9PSEU|nr:GNAT family N-acetyltransferase [Prauserella endophytica]TKG65264.1 GNAT family N-acetyltransferase [Prauserella endophytica]